MEVIYEQFDVTALKEIEAKRRVTENVNRLNMEK